MKVDEERFNVMIERLWNAIVICSGIGAVLFVLAMAFLHIPRWLPYILLVIEFFQNLAYLNLGKLVKSVLYAVAAIFISVFGLTVVLFVVVDLVGKFFLPMVFLLLAGLVANLGETKNKRSQEDTSQEAKVNPEINHLSTQKTIRSNYISSYGTDEDRIYESSLRDDDPNYEERMTEHQVEMEYEREAWEETWTYDPD